MGTIAVTNITDGTTADAADVNSQINTIVAEFNGGIDNDNIASDAAIVGSKLADASINATTKLSTWDGWVAVADSWTYASATTITVPSDATAKYSVGDKIRITNNTVKYFYVTAVAATTLTVSGGSDYTVANAAISAISYSKAATPLSFPQWFAFTPTLNTFTVGSGTVVGEFTMHGKTVRGEVFVTFGASMAFGTTTTLTLPVAGATKYATRGLAPIGNIAFLDSGTAVNFGLLTISSSSTVAQLRYETSGGTNGVLNTTTSSTPMTLASGDLIAISFEYQTA